MPVRRRGNHANVGYVVVERDGDGVDGRAAAVELDTPTRIVRRVLRRSYARRDSVDVDSDSDDDLDDLDDELEEIKATPRPSGLPTLASKTESQPSLVALANSSNPAETIVVSFQPPKDDRDGRISQTTEHLLIAAGSIGATIIIVMIILAIYTMRKRGLTLLDVLKNSKDSVRRRAGPPLPPKYLDRKQTYDDDYMYVGKDMNAPRPAAAGSRSGSLSTQTRLQPLGRSDSFKPDGLDRQGSTNRSFLLDPAPPTRQNSHRRDISATPSSPILPIQDTRGSASTRNTRSLDGDDEELRYSDNPPQQDALPAPPTFKQFLSNRPTISQRPGLGGAMMSRFSWTNSNAPQTPRENSRDTVSQPVAGRDSFMTQRSSVPRFRTVDSWVNQQSTRVAEQRLKQQFRNTQTSTYSSDSDDVPEMPAVPPPKTLPPLSRMNSFPGKDIKHKRHDTTTTIQTAPIFKQHPGTEVRFSAQSTVPSEVLDMGRKNAAL